MLFLFVEITDYVFHLHTLLKNKGQILHRSN
jgi:hypothetical protein